MRDMRNHVVDMFPKLSKPSQLSLPAQRAHTTSMPLNPFFTKASSSRYLWTNQYFFHCMWLSSSKTTGATATCAHHIFNLSQILKRSFSNALPLLNAFKSLKFNSIHGWIWGMVCYPCQICKWALSRSCSLSCGKDYEPNKPSTFTLFQESQVKWPPEIKNTLYKIYYHYWLHTLNRLQCNALNQSTLRLALWMDCLSVPRLLFLQIFGDLQIMYLSAKECIKVLPTIPVSLLVDTAFPSSILSGGMCVWRPGHLPKTPPRVMKQET